MNDARLAEMARATANRQNFPNQLPRTRERSGQRPKISPTKPRSNCHVNGILRDASVPEVEFAVLASADGKQHSAGHAAAGILARACWCAGMLLRAFWRGPFWRRPSWRGHARAGHAAAGILAQAMLLRAKLARAFSCGACCCGHARAGHAGAGM